MLGKIDERGKNIDDCYRCEFFFFLNGKREIESVIRIRIERLNTTANTLLIYRFQQTQSVNDPVTRK